MTLGLLLLPLVFTGYYITKREVWIGLAGAAFWLVLGLYYMLDVSSAANPSQITDIWMGLAWVCIGLCLVTGLAPWVWKPTPQESWEEDEDDYGNPVMAQYIKGEPTGKTRPLTTLEERDKGRNANARQARPQRAKASDFGNSGEL